MEPFEFKGYDYTELAACFGINLNISDSDEELFKDSLFSDVEGYIIASWISVMFHKSYDDLQQKIYIIENCKTFLQKLLDQQENSHSDVFRGLLSIKDDHVFIDMFTRNIEYLWT